MHLRGNPWFSLILVLCLGTAACAASLYRNYGQFNPSGEVTKAFEGYRVHPEYRYYVSGPDINPNALMGLHRNYRLDPSLRREARSGGPPSE
jgi:hypothetical protein